ncbi:NmrA family NAD(P)-binding protein [Williamsia herbipolensis]|uniref:NmrA family NAD(P)-binding protein n=1 Tax=Williamsia herbipolensis TaxID=1603258 RepID=A0AAU4JYX4_9NOCA|nr:NmrA family NAD(P)-binding protein [Williamsia herbipolensis]
MILVTGAGGGMGRALVRDLHGRGVDVRAFVKNEHQATTARRDGATDAVIGDIRSSGDLTAAVAGVERIFHANPTSVVREVTIAEALVAAAQENGVGHIVYHSVIHPDIAEMFHHQEKGRVEDVLRESAVPTTVLRPSHFMQNYLDFWEFLRGGTLPYPTSPDSVMGVVDSEDVSEVGGRILTSPVAEHAGRTYDLSTQELTRHEMATIWGDVLGHGVSAVRLPPDVVKNPLRGVGTAGVVLVKSLRANAVHAPVQVLRGLVQSSNAKGVRSWPEESRDCYVAMMNYYDRNGLPAGDMTVLPALLGRPATSYREFAVREATRRGSPVTSSSR